MSPRSMSSFNILIHDQGRVRVNKFLKWSQGIIQGSLLNTKKRASDLLYWVKWNLHQKAFFNREDSFAKHLQLLLYSNLRWYKVHSCIMQARVLFVFLNYKTIYKSSFNYMRHSNKLTRATTIRNQLNSKII